MKFTKEQQQIIEASKGDSNLIVNAYAGAGKTSTLVGVVDANPSKHFVYLAFNRSVAEEAKKKFKPYKNCEIKSINGFCYGKTMWWFGGYEPMKERLSNSPGNQKIRATKNMCQLLSCKKRIYYAARDTLTRYKNSASREISYSHIPYFAHILPYQKMDPAGVEDFKTKVLHTAMKLWELQSERDSNFPIDHDTYVKIYHLRGNKSNVKQDVVLLDEAQDINPVFEACVGKMDTCQIILVGDSFQSIYQWRGAVDTLSNFGERDDYEKHWLTKSFRFGDEIAGLGNNIIQALKADSPELIGFEQVESTVTKNIEALQGKYTVLCRTNSGVMEVAFAEITKKKKVYIEGSIEPMIKRVEALFNLYKGKDHKAVPTVYYPYEKFEDVIDDAKHDVEMARDVAFVQEHDDETPKVLDILRKNVVDKADKADIIVSTTHKAKGLEWDQVLMHHDFAYDSTVEAEWNLIYVAATRAKKLLVADYEYIQFACENISKINAMKAEKMNAEFNAVMAEVGEQKPEPKGFDAFVTRELKKIDKETGQ